MRPARFAAHPVLRTLALVAALALAGCQTAEDRAEDHYRSAMALLAAGDADRAAIEFRNVFDLNGFHKEARTAYAGLLISQGKTSEAYGQYLRLIEQYPDTFEARRDLAQMAIQRGDWAEAERHGREAIRLSPEDPVARAVSLALDYRTATLDRDDAARAKTVTAAEALLAEPAPAADPAATAAPVAGLPGAPQILRRLLISDRLASPDPQSALPLLETALEAEPDALELYLLKLRLLAQAEDVPGTGALLRTMVTRFPDNDEVKASMIGWFLSQRDIEGAEAFLRAEAGGDTADPAGHSAVIQLLQAARGPDAARAEIERLLAANTGTPNADLYGALLATLDFEAGKKDEALAGMEAILAKAAPSDQTRRLKVMQGRMLEATGNAVGARARIEEVLAEDPAQVEALKQRAAWRIRTDDPGGAIVDLRAALDQSPRDPQILTLMAEAHERDGAMELAGERLALAVEVSGNRADESLRYAAFLLRDNRTQPALTVLTDARRVAPGDPRILGALARLYLAERDWGSAGDIVTALRALPQPEAQATAQEVQAAILLGQDKVDEGLSYLSTLVGNQTSGASDTHAVAMILETQVRSGRLPEARVYLDGLIRERPADGDLKLMSAGLYALAGEPGPAEDEYRALIAAEPTAETPVRLLYALLQSQGRRDDAVALVDAALAAQPQSGTLRWMKAGHLEQAGDIDGAIAIYEGLYADDSANVIVANNLASLITTHKDDAASLDRAFAVARRLRGTEVPAFADTYGWIAFRRGDLDAALEYLEPAARGLPGDPLVQMHLGLTYAALARTEDARRQLARAIEVAGPDTKLPQMAAAAAKLAELGGPLPATQEAAPAAAPAQP